MARWIDADDAIARIRKLWNKDEPIEEAYIYDDYAFGLMDAIDAVEDSPSRPSRKESVMAKTLKEIAIELLEKYEASETTAICEYSTNITQSEKLLKTEIDKYRKAIDKADGERRE